ncbi:hypothetical protein I2501_05580 [Streptacidiphilus sp. NEAU-YB345]|uniref:XRE family transcriptional regulator n=1 Tax=Streptacidiphilus fuscans TaxID=2789292 RepID=A0A931AZ55_9ACTN|nr:hypothetical protein [Streptacidiphilus fuscans]
MAERLNAWFADAATTDAVGRRREPSTAEVAQAISENPSHDVTISRSYLAALRNGSQTNPTISVLTAIVQYFRARPMTLPVSVNALINEESTGAAEDPAWSSALADRQVRSIAMRAGGMTPEMREQLLSIMDALDAPRPSAPNPEGQDTDR